MGSVGTFLIDATITNDWVQGLSLPIDGSRDIPNANYKIRKKRMKGINIGIEIGLIVEVFGMLTMV